MFVAYRDGFTNAAWKSAPASTKVDLVVEGAYTVTVVCLIDGGNTLVTWQASHTVDDDILDDKAGPTVQTPCNNPAPARHTNTGKMLQAGTAHLDANSAASTSPNWDVSLLAVNGTYDLVATDTTAHKTLITRGVVINGDTALGTIDASTGAQLTPIGLVVDNPPAAPDPTDPDDTHTETVEGSVQVITKNNSGPAEVFSGTYDLTKKAANVLGLPASALAAGDVQQATFTGTNHPAKTNITTTRSITRPFKPGDAQTMGKITYTLPTLISIPAWAFDNHRLTVALPALPALDDLTISTSGTASDGSGTKTARYEMNITTNYFGATLLARPVFDTDITGFPAAAKIDFTKAFSRHIVSQHDVVTKKVVVGHETSSYDETVNPETP